MEMDFDKQPASVLLVDDRSDNLLALEAVFDDCGYRLVRATSGSQALKHLLTQDFAVVLLDVQMPGLDGIETAALIRSRQRSRHTPIIFITAISTESRNVFRGYTAGAVDYIFKPFEPEILRAKVAVFVELFRKNRQIALQAELLRLSEQRERERGLAELRRTSERRYRNLADNVPQLVWTTRPDGVIDYVNARWVEYTGLSMQVSGTKVLYELLHPDDVARGHACWQHAMGEVIGVRCEARLRRAQDGVYRWHLIQLVPERDKEGQVVSWLATATDIDDEKRTAEALAAEKERLAVTLRSIGDGVITTDTEGRVEVLNRAAEAMTGWSQAEAAGRPLTEVFRLESGRDGAEGENRFQQVLQSGTTLAPDSEARLVGCENALWIAYSATPIRTQDKPILGMVLVFRDITDKQRLEDERLKASKLESIGVLAGAIAHDFNNILTAILGNVSLAKLYLGHHDQVTERLTEAEKASLWAKDLTQQLLTFSKGGAPVKKTLWIGPIVLDAVQFAARGSHARTEFALAPDLWPVDADEGQIRQVFHNLVLNAQQAMPNGGRIRIAGDNVHVRSRRKLPLAPGRYVRFTCEDQGMGIPTAHLQRIFDPYFTTKQRGSGLGLATTYSILKRHGGLITVESNVGQGAMFHVYLPASEAKPVIETPSGLACAPIKGGRILVMDDEASIRDLLGRLFERLGYEVGFAEDGAQALERYAQARSDGHPFDLVIMDLVVPGGMGGCETMKQLRQIDANACAIVSSGYSNDPIMSDYAKHGFCDAVAKPYKNEELHCVVQRVLSARQASAA